MAARHLVGVCYVTYNSRDAVKPVDTTLARYIGRHTTERAQRASMR